MVRDYLVQLGSAVLPARLASISKEAVATTQEEGTKSFLCSQVATATKLEMVIVSYSEHGSKTWCQSERVHQGGKVQKHCGWKQGG